MTKPATQPGIRIRSGVQVVRMHGDCGQKHTGPRVKSSLNRNPLDLGTWGGAANSPRSASRSFLAVYKEKPFSTLGALNKNKAYFGIKLRHGVSKLWLPEGLLRSFRTPICSGNGRGRFRSVVTIQLLHISVPGDFFFISAKFHIKISVSRSYCCPIKLLRSL